MTDKPEQRCPHGVLDAIECFECTPKPKASAREWRDVTCIHFKFEAIDCIDEIRPGIHVIEYSAWETENKGRNNAIEFACQLETKLRTVTSALTESQNRVEELERELKQEKNYSAIQERLADANQENVDKALGQIEKLKAELAEARRERHDIKCPNCKQPFWFVQEIGKYPRDLSVVCEHLKERDQAFQLLRKARECIANMHAEFKAAKNLFYANALGEALTEIDEALKEMGGGDAD